MQQPINDVQVEIEVKRSRFIAFGFAVDSREAFEAHRRALQVLHPDASHHCWAFKLAMGGLCGQSDDGEPKGTAGMPMLTVLTHSNYVNLGVVVVRYFGGTKLGTGGIARAYADAVKAALEQFEYTEVVTRCEYKLAFDYNYEADIRRLIKNADAQCVDVIYENNVTLTVAATEKQWPPLKQQIIDTTRGLVHVTNAEDQ